MGRGVIRIANHISTDYIVERTVSPANKVIGAKRLGTTNVVVLTFEHANIPRNVLIFGENNPVQKYRKTVPTCSRCGTIGHRNDVCPNPSAPPNSCPSCGKSNVNLADHECPTGCLLCNGPHTTGARECPKRFRPASKSPRYGNEGNPSTSPTQENLNQRASRSRSPSRQRGATKTAEHQNSEGQSPGPNPESRPASPAATTRKHRSRSRGPKQASKNPQVYWAEPVTPTQPTNQDYNQTITQLHKTISSKQLLLEKQQRKIEQLERALKSRTPSPTPKSAKEIRTTEPNSMETDTLEHPTTHKPLPSATANPSQVEQISDLVIKTLMPLIQKQNDEIQAIKELQLTSLQQIKEQGLIVVKEAVQPKLLELDALIIKYQRNSSQLDMSKARLPIKQLTGRKDTPSIAYNVGDTDDSSSSSSASLTSFSTLTI
ncbi:hypothetical protein HPB51_023649 [Rhipicephalus microplus]|uniref:CCHC-type domain-containing protein n=1 Tax=Rhipicephalus microplus TaxID=6941 RepID=A0A9J6EIU9_RHIMP|nr:hypothetical protein HPB51_023649 [Rhipicephalus microplus]